MRKYRRILFQNCVLEIFYAVTSGISQTEAETYNGIIVNVVMGVPNATRNQANIITAVWMFSLYALILFVPTPFVYRYLVIVQRVVVTWKVYIIIVIPPTLNVLLLSIGNYYAMSTTPACSEEVITLMKAYHDGINFACQPHNPMRNYYTNSELSCLSKSSQRSFNVFIRVDSSKTSVENYDFTSNVINHN
uniref:G_PROTEIN_RECEP_F1_2 domain-containing protein n=1 Tax=Panagrellus redivivus TaxID=6233 RepID=A0A7E4VNG8_PANRE